MSIPPHGVFCGRKTIGGKYDAADGIRRAFTRFGKWVRTTVAPAMEKPRNEIAQLLPGFAEMFDTYDG